MQRVCYYHGRRLLQTWTGRRENAYESIRAGIGLELRVEPSAEASLSIDTFLMRLKPVPSSKTRKR